MKWDELADQQCSIARSLAVIGDRWTLMILSDFFLGATRFEQLRARLQISRTIIANRLQLLVDEGVLLKKPYQQQPIRYEYKLTSKGRELYPIVMSIVHWGDKHYTDEAGPPILHTHKTCGCDFVPVMTCSECTQPLEPRETSARKRPDDSVYPAVERGPV